VPESGSVAAASRMLNIAQGALTTSMLELESELGSVLFVRSSRGMTLTPRGASCSLLHVVTALLPCPGNRRPCSLYSGHVKA